MYNNSLALLENYRKQVKKIIVSPEYTNKTMLSMMNEYDDWIGPTQPID